ncbi:TonB-dependent receptor plug domain-containing protein [Pedobacter sp. AW31-3R]|uniref:TonB-dependent receptor plug domain-containing protein n=1 Tax=Pedobacter sp. AW31-3R TaxID=3445781 RepID=UPI003F9FCFD5
MKAKCLKISFLFIVSIAFFAFRMQDDPFDALLKKFSAYSDEHPQEKVHLHFDKPYYAIGDDIWFKAYIIDNSTHQPSLISSALIVELIDENDSLRRQIKLPVVSGIGWGDFKLPDTLQEGNYRVRAYTQWMRNAGPDYFYDKTIKIGNAWANKVFTSTSYSTSLRNDKEYIDAVIRFNNKQGNPYPKQNVTYVVSIKDKIVARGKGMTNEMGEISLSYENKVTDNKANDSKTIEKAPSPDKITATITLPNKQVVVKNIPLQSPSAALAVQLFPEGGNLVENLPSRVGIKAVNSRGLGEEVSGTVVDNNGNEVFNFRTNPKGMGFFVVNPQPGKTYTSIITLKDGAVQKIPLPAALPSGHVIHADASDTSKIIVKLYTSETLLNKGEIKLVVQHDNTILAVTRSSAAKQVSLISIPKKDLPSGIIHLTLFDTANLPVAERLVFNQNKAERIDLDFRNLKSGYGKRGHMELEFSAKDGGKPTQGSFSIAVTNTAVIAPDERNESNILTSLLLTSDLKGYVEKPNDYFLSQDRKTSEDLDCLMLTQGWSRFLWKDFTGAPQPSKAPSFAPEKDLQVSGTITTLGGKPVAKGRVSLVSTSGGLFMIDTLTDDKGRFTFDKLVFGDSTKFIVQARNAKNKKYVEINVDVVPGQVITKNKNTGDVEVNVNESIQQYIRKSEGYFDELTRRGLLQRTFVLDEVKIVQQKNPAKNSSNLNGAGHADFVMTSKDLGTCFNIVQCLQGRVAGLIFKNDIPYLMRNGNTPMQIILDGMNIEADFLSSIQPVDVETIEVLKNINNTAIYGSRGSGGVLIITTKRGGGDMSYSRYSPGIVTYVPKGYYAAREFYSPKYTPENTSPGLDNRSTVFWTPHVPTDINGTGKFNFYNTDEPGKYRVVIEGINSAGHLARKVYTYEVK